MPALTRLLRFAARACACAVAFLGLSEAAAAQVRWGGGAAPVAPTARRVAVTGPSMGLHGSSVSADGRYLAYTDWTTGDLALFDLTNDGHRRVTNKGPLRKVLEFAESFVRFSRDGRRLAYVWDRNGYELWTGNVDGSGRRFVYRNEPGRGEVLVFDWSADERYVAAIVPRASRDPQDSTRQIALIALRDGSVEPLKDLPPSTVVGAMAFSPNGRFLAYEMSGSGGSPEPDIFLLRIDRVEETPVTTRPGSDRLLGWTPDGNGILFASDRSGANAAWFQRIDGSAVSRAPEIAMENLPADARPLGFRRDGAFYYAVSAAYGNDVHTAAIDTARAVLSDRPMSVTRGDGSNEAPDWSPDGKQLAYVHGGNTIAIRSVETGTIRSFVPQGMQRIFTVASGDRYARWSPDGRTLLAPQNRTLFLINVATAAALPAVTDRRSRFGRWSPDGGAIYYSRQPGANDSPFEIARLKLDDGTKSMLYRSPLPGDNVGSLELSPDGRWIAFSDVALNASDEERRVLRVISTDGGAPRALLTVTPSEDLKVVGWTPDAGEILFTRFENLTGDPGTAVWRIPRTGGEPRPLELGASVLTHLRFHKDGRRVAYDTGRRGAEIWMLENFRSKPRTRRTKR